MVTHGEGGDEHGAGAAHDAHGGHGGRPPRSFAAKFVIPLAIPVIAALVIFSVLWSVSRVLLAMPGDGATPIAILLAIGVLLLCAFVATAPRISKGAVYAVIGVPLIGIYIAGIGSGIYLHNERPESAAAKLTPLPAQQTTTDNKFSVTQFTFAAGGQVTINLKNDGQAVHNFHITNAQDASGNDIKSKNLAPGDTDTLTFTLAGPRAYSFRCDFHPTEMTGTIQVINAGGAEAAAGGGAPGELAQTATDNKFSPTSFTIDHGTKATLTLQNKGTATHNWHVLNVKNPDGSDIKTDLTDGGKTATISFEVDQPGQYPYQCDVHPTEMKGTLTVK
jgi:plastocyanin